MTNEDIKLSTKLKSIFKGANKAKYFEKLQLAIIQNFEQIFQVNQPTQTNYASEKDVFFDNISNIILKTKSEIFDILQRLANTFGTVLWNTFEDSEIEKLADWLEIFEFPEVRNDVSCTIPDYFSELETAKSNLVSRKEIVFEYEEKYSHLEQEKKQLHAKNIRLLDDSGQKVKEVKNLREIVLNFSNESIKQFDLIENWFQDTKGLTREACRVRVIDLKQKLEKINKVVQEAPDANNDFINENVEIGSQIDYVNSFNLDFEPNVDERMIWFDFEKSKKRYDQLLDSYRKNIEKKDKYIDSLEKKLIDGKKERLKQQEEFTLKFIKKQQNKPDILASASKN